MSSSRVSLVVPGDSLTIALSCPHRVFIRVDLPTLGFPVRTTTTPSLTRQASLVCLRSVEKISFVSFILKVSPSCCPVSLMSSSGKSNEASTLTLTSERSVLRFSIFVEKTPSSDLLAALAVAADELSIRSTTASAWVRSILSFKKALFVNSPGPASLAPYSIRA